MFDLSKKGKDLEESIFLLVVESLIADLSVKGIANAEYTICICEPMIPWPGACDIPYNSRWLQ